MAQDVLLIGAESVASAGRQMSVAAGDMRQAAGTMDEAARQMRVICDAFTSQLELVLAEHRDRMVELLEDDRKARAGQPVKIVDGLPGSGSAT